jgi:3-oxoacyl-[acyl-carrier protein] reductase
MAKGDEEMTKQTVLITGASRGIGAATAEVFAQAGYQVAVNYHSSPVAAEQLCEKLNGQFPGCAKAFRCDVSDSAQVKTMIADVQDAFGTIDVLVCNAGISRPNLFTDISDGEWAELFQVNVNGVFYPCREVLPGMIHEKSGRIITVSSMWGLTGGSCEVAYSATKAAVIGLTRALAKEVGPSGITVNCVAPGVIRTEMNAALSEDDLAVLREETPLERIGEPEEVAKAILYLASEGASFITGQVIPVDGGMVIG